MNFKLAVLLIQASFISCLSLLFVPQSLGQQWEALGPDRQPAIAVPGDYMLKMANGVGRVSCLRFENEMNGTNSLYLGSPYGGLYKSVDNGNYWIEVPWGNITPGVSDFVIHPRNRDIQYVLTGDPDCILDPNNPALGSEACQSGGMYRTADNGKSRTEKPVGNWYDTSGRLLPDFWKYPSMKVMRKMLINPRRPKYMYVVIHTYNYGIKEFESFIYRTTDAGKNWKVSLYVTGEKLKDLEFNPANPRIIYAGGSTVYRTTDGGRKWVSLQPRGLPADSLIGRTEICTNSIRPNLLYVLAGNVRSKQNEIYYSDNGGDTFRLAGKGALSPEWRTAFAMNPKDTTRIYISCGNKVCVYVNNGKEYKLSSTVTTIHDDIHELNVHPVTSEIFASTDGGLYMSADSGKTWSSMNSGLHVAECWSVAVSRNGTEKILSGLQDCGTILFDADSSEDYLWETVRGGDGMEAMFDPGDPSICYSVDGNNNIFARSMNGGYRWSRNLAIFNEPLAYLHPFVLNPLNANTVFLPYHNLYKSNDRGDNFQLLPPDDLPVNKESVCAIAIAPRDSNVIYIAYTNPSWNESPREKLFRTENGGINWTDISAGLDGVKYQNISSLVVDPDDPMHITAGFRGGGGIKVMSSDRGGNEASWKDISGGLPAEADFNAMIYVSAAGSNVLYAATHRGVWQWDAVSSRWSITGNGLPPVMVSDLDYRPASKTLYAGTHGRGIWRMILN